MTEVKEAALALQAEEEQIAQRRSSYNTDDDDSDSLRNAYMAGVGFYQGVCDVLGWKKETMAQYINGLALSFGRTTPPPISINLMTRLGLVGVYGFDPRARPRSTGRFDDRPVSGFRDRSPSRSGFSDRLPRSGSRSSNASHTDSHDDRFLGRREPQQPRFPSERSQSFDGRPRFDSPARKPANADEGEAIEEDRFARPRSSSWSNRAPTRNR